MGRVVTVINSSVAIGLFMVLVVYAIVAALDGFGLFQAMTNGHGIGQGILFSAFIYFGVRVVRDVALIVIGGLNAKGLIYKVYFIEVVVGLPLMYFFASVYGGQGLFAALSLACMCGLAMLLQYVKSIDLLHIPEARDVKRSI